MATGRTTRGAGSATIGRGTTIRGRVSGDGDLAIEGTIEGDVTLGGDVSFNAGSVMQGDVESRGAVRIFAGARVNGNVKSDDISLEDGADFAGELSADFDLPSELSQGSHAAAAPAPGARRR